MVNELNIFIHLFASRYKIALQNQVTKITKRKVRAVGRNTQLHDSDHQTLAADYIKQLGGSVALFVVLERQLKRSREAGQEQNEGKISRALPTRLRRNNKKKV